MHDWKELTMEFTMASRSYFIRGETEIQLSHGFFHSMQKLLNNGMESFLMQLVKVSNSKAAAPPAETTTELDQFLTQYQSVFRVPSTLPPARTHDHRIPLEPSTSAVNVCPYQYPHIQKNEIE